MRDPIYAGIEIDISKPEGSLLHAMNGMYNAANNAFAMLVRVSKEEVDKVRKELNVPEQYTMQAIADHKDSAFNALHFQLLKPFVNELHVDQKEYLYALGTFFSEVYAISYLRQQPTEEGRARAERAYNKLSYSLTNCDKIFNEALLGPNMKNVKIVEFLKKQLTDIIAAKKATVKMVEKTESEGADVGTDSNTAT